MKKLTVILVVLMSSISLSNAQTQQTSRKEIGSHLFIPFSVESIALYFDCKFALTEKTWLRLNLDNVKVNYSERNYTYNGEYPYSNISFSAGVMAGLEFRVPLGEKFCVYHGPNIGYTTMNQWTKTENPAIPADLRSNRYELIKPFVSYALGLRYKLNTRFSLGAEIMPSVYFSREVFHNFYNNGYDAIEDKFGFNYSDQVGKIVFTISL
ncbi:MAG TPA: hypothetical protein PLA77_08190 [Bacteroidales bacterium]|nr:hypothetical protein [Bacteroidales bacterium]